MDVSLVLTVIGRDKPGIVGEMARVVREHDANWEESRMARLASRFAGILRVTVADARADELARNLKALSTKGLEIVVDRDEAAAVATTQRILRFDLLGNDRPGIVRDIARCLAERGVNIEELETESKSAPMAGGNLFKATATLRVPAELGVDELRGALEALANDLMVDVHLGQVD